LDFFSFSFGFWFDFGDSAIIRMEGIFLTQQWLAYIGNLYAIYFNEFRLSLKVHLYGTISPLALNLFHGGTYIPYK